MTGFISMIWWAGGLDFALPDALPELPESLPDPAQAAPSHNYNMTSEVSSMFDIVITIIPMLIFGGILISIVGAIGGGVSSRRRRKRTWDNEDTEEPEIAVKSTPEDLRARMEEQYKRYKHRHRS